MTAGELSRHPERTGPAVNYKAPPLALQGHGAKPPPRRPDLVFAGPPCASWSTPRAALTSQPPALPIAQNGGGSHGAAVALPDRSRSPCSSAALAVTSAAKTVVKARAAPFTGVRSGVFELVPSSEGSSDEEVLSYEEESCAAEPDPAPPVLQSPPAATWTTLLEHCMTTEEALDGLEPEGAEVITHGIVYGGKGAAGKNKKQHETEE